MAEKQAMVEAYQQQPQPYPGPGQPSGTQQQQLPPPAVYNPQTQTVYISTGSPSSRRDNYKGRLSLIFGVTLIVLQAIALVLGFAAIIGLGNRHFLDNIILSVYPAAWGAVLVFTAGGFAIAAGKRKTKGLIITQLVLSIIASVFVCLFLVLSLVSLGIDSSHLRYSGSRGDTRYYDQVSLGLSLLLTVVALAMFLVMVWLSTLSCRVLCATTTTVIVAEPMQVVHVGEMQNNTVACQSQEPEPESPPPCYSEMPTDGSKQGLQQ